MRTRYLAALVIGLLLSAQISTLFGQTLEEIIYDVTEMADGSVEQARLEAQRQAVGAGPAYRSFKKNERKSFSEEYTPPELTEDKRGRFVYGLALFSDDGCNVTVKGSQIHGRLARNQHLPNIDESFHVLPVGISPGQPVTITVDYANTIYDDDIRSPGYPDIDGVTLVLYLIPMELAVDANRDGDIQLGRARDRTEANRPFRFWCNDDNDGTGNGAEFLGGVADSSDTEIGSKRDLEDFARLWLRIGALHKEIAAGTIKIGLKWRNSTNPAIKVYRAAEANGRTRYLTGNAAATSQISGDYKTAKATVVGTTATMLPTSVLASLTEQRPTTHFLFEGVSEGTGQLVLTIHTADGKETGEAPGVWLALKDVKEMYLRGMALPEDIPAPYDSTITQPSDPGIIYSPDSNGPPFSQPQDEAQQTIVFVHGWRMPYEESVNWAETMYKRLWHRGFKGRFAFFRWPTFTGSPLFARYNESEYRAWKCGGALKQFVASLPYQNAMNICAHSMGNIVVSSALKQGMTVNNYILMQAAVPSGCYNVNQANHQPFVDNAEGDPSPDGASDLGYRGFLDNITGNLVDFYNFNDDALEAWDANNTLYKPNQLITATQSYGYEPSYQIGQRCTLVGLLTARLVLDPHESMAFVASSRTIVAGREQTAGAIDSNVDLDANYQFGNLHSPQWEWRIQRLKPFYDRMLLTYQITPNP
jgi:pimeloyl-ACP methyl ester carboxylesterase